MLQDTQSIVFRDLVSFLAFELDQPPEAVRHVLWRDPSGVPLLLEKLHESVLFEWGATVAEPIFQGASRRGAALVEAKVQLQASYLKRLVEKQIQSADSAIGPISVELTSGVLFHYREKITRKMEALLSEVRKSMAGGVGGIHRLVAGSPELRCVQEYFEEIVASLLGNRHMLQEIVQAFSGGEGAAGLKNGINAALVAMAVLSLYPRPRSPEEKKSQLLEVGMAAVFQDISLLAEPDTPDEKHCELSAQIAAQRGATKGVVELVRLHHTVRTPEGLPILQDPDALGEQAKVLVAINVFLNMVHQDRSGSTVEFMKRLSHLSAGKYIDNTAVSILRRMCLPNLKASLLEGATSIGKGCLQGDSSAILWPIAGDRIPSVFICKNTSCNHRTSQTIFLSRNLPFIVDGRLIDMIDKGDYQVCSLLSVELRKLYAAV
ncbi:MAG: hypothetical protein HGB17_16125, partial [Syntrophobacteraceae bacterium]|nr:hypothetical protein [Syntrophobacteraceae bacterium]